MIIETKAYRGCLMRRTKKSTRNTTGMVRGRVGNALANAPGAFERDKKALRDTVFGLFVRNLQFEISSWRRRPNNRNNAYATLDLV